MLIYVITTSPSLLWRTPIPRDGSENRPDGWNRISSAIEFRYLCPSSVEFKGSKLERSWVNMQTKTFWDNWWSNSETLIPIERCGQFPRQLYTTIALPYVRPWRQRCWPLDMGSMRFPWWALFRKMPKTLGKNTNVSNRSFLGNSLFNLVHHSQTTHKKLHLKYNWKLIFFLLSRELYATRIKVIGMSVSLSWPLFKAASQVWSQAGL